MGDYYQDLSRVLMQLTMCADIVQKCASKLDALQTEAQELIALVGKTEEGDTQALVQALAAISEAKPTARSTLGPIGEAQQAIKKYMDGP